MSFKAEKLSKIFLHSLAEIINREIEFKSDVLVTVTRVEVGVDLDEARVWISVMPFEKSSEVMAELINSKHKIKKILSKDIKIRKIPDLIFILDETEERAGEIEKMIDKI